MALTCAGGLVIMGSVHQEDLRDLARGRSGNLLSQGANARNDEGLPP